MDNKITSIGDCYLTVNGTKYPVSEYNCTYAVNTIPMCTLSMAFGWSLKDGPTTAKRTSSGNDFIASLKLESQETEASQYMVIDGETKKIFHGVVLSAGYATVANALGTSQLQVNVVLQHIAGTLFTLSLTQFTYLSDALYNSLGQSFSVLSAQQKGAAGHGLFDDSTLYKSISDLSTMYTEVPASSVDVIDIVHKMLDRLKRTVDEVRAGKEVGARNSVAEYQKARDLIKGDRFRLSDRIRQPYPYVKQLCTSYANLVSKQDAMSALMNLLPSPDFLIQVVPNSPDYVSLVPISTFIGTPGKTLSKDTIQFVSMNVGMSRDVRGADSVAVCGYSSNVFDKGALQDPILATYPKSGTPVKKVMAVQAPEWISNQDRGTEQLTQGRIKPGASGVVSRTNQTKGASREAIVIVADAYAKLMYLNHLYGGTSITLRVLSKSPSSGAVTGIDDLQYLGKQIKVDASPNSVIDPASSYNTIIGVLSDITLHYRGVPGASSMDVMYNLTSAHTEDVNNRLKLDRNPIYD